MINFALIHKPLITEKSNDQGDLRKYFFEVCPRATKTSLKESIEKIFAVKVSSINIINQKGKLKRFKGTIGKRKNIKKAIVTLEKDNSIDLAGGIK